jgi:hypothetical protein
MKYILLLGFLLFTPIASAQSIAAAIADDTSRTAISKKNDSTRVLYVQLHTGLLECCGLGVGVQLSKNYSILLKGSNTFIGGQGSFMFPQDGSGYGVQFSYYSKFWVFNSINFEYLKYTDISICYPPRDLGYFLDLNFANENVGKKFYNAFWSLGICISVARNSPILVYPSIKYGMNLNIF